MKKQEQINQKTLTLRILVDFSMKISTKKTELHVN